MFPKRLSEEVCKGLRNEGVFLEVREGLPYVKWHQHIKDGFGQERIPLASEVGGWCYPSANSECCPDSLHDPHQQKDMRVCFTYYGWDYDSDVEEEPSRASV